MYSLIFLDIDGVLNRRSWYKRNHKARPRIPYPQSHFDPALCKRVHDALTPFNPLIVISSTWRIKSSVEEISGFLVPPGLTHPIIGLTPRTQLLPTCKDGKPWNRIGRGLEIQQWLRTYVPNVAGARIAIIDDDSDMGQLLPWHVHTAGHLGFLPKNVKRLAKVLSKPTGITSWKLDDRKICYPGWGAEITPEGLVLLGRGLY